MGEDKALMSVGGVPVFRRILDVFEKLFAEILIVTNEKGRLAGYGYPELVDLIPGCGPLGGVYTGLHFAKSGSIFVASCDLPFIHASIVELLMKEAGDYDIVAPEAGGRLHPLHAIYSKRCIPSMRQRIEKGLLDMTGFVNDAEGLSVKRIRMDELPLFNMNTPEEWREANKIAR